MAGKYREYQSRRQTSIRDYQRVHPVWRGVGFAMMVLIPVISYAAADLILRSNAKKGWFPLPEDLFAHPGQFLINYFPDELLYIRLILFFAIMLLLFAIFTLVSFMMNSAFGVSERQDPYYVPPIRRQVRRRR